jgi:hypothetical protein
MNCKDWITFLGYPQSFGNSTYIDRY